MKLYVVFLLGIVSKICGVLVWGVLVWLGTQKDTNYSYFWSITMAALEGETLRLLAQ